MTLEAIRDRHDGKPIVVAMSGGVDSSVAAALLVEAGCEVIGITLQLYDHGAAVRKKGACCAGQDIQDARMVADRLGIAHYVLDFEERFKASVIDDFASAYAAGRTPIPCVRCNERIKFRDLLEIARDLGAGALATGHYVKKALSGTEPVLEIAVDAERDQSYFLFATTRRQLEFLEFPLGHLTKDETRAHAQRLGLEVAAKPDSQDICFVPQGHYGAVVDRLRPDARRPGEIVHVDGRTLGEHEGVTRFTVGQRRGLKVATGEPLYVVGIDAGKARITVGPRQAGLIASVILEDVNWLVDPAPDETFEVKHRYNEVAVEGSFRHDRQGRCVVEFTRPQAGVAPGQACVLYRGRTMIGGGWIAGTEAVQPNTLAMPA